MIKEKLNLDKYNIRIIGTVGNHFNEKGIDLELKLLLKKYKTEIANNSNEQTDETFATDETSTTLKKMILNCL